MSPVAEPASVALRRLHEDVARTITSTREAQARVDAERATVSLLPALADLVELAEQDAARCRHPAHYGEPCATPLCRALAALRKRLAKP